MPRKKNENCCKKCPYKYEKDGCPFWIDADVGFVETNNVTGETRLTTGCFMHIIPRILAHCIAATERPAEVLQGWRNDMVEKFDQFGRRVTFAAVMDSLGPIKDGVRAIQILPPDRGQLPSPEGDENV